MFQDMLNRVSKMDMIPCYIMIFRLYKICSEKKEGDIDIKDEGFMAYAYLFWYRAISKHVAIGKNIKEYIKIFFKMLD
jgi:hypothetical protein